MDGSAARDGGAAVRRIIRDRIAEGSRPGARRDNATVALVCEGGGMRGVIAGGMVTAMEHMGMRDAFDILCGTSAGAFACAYFGAGQAELGTRIFSEDLCDGRFISLRRGALGGRVMNIDYLVDTVTVLVKPLDAAALMASGCAFACVATEVATGDARPLRPLGGPGRLREILRASACTPIIAGPPVMIDGERFVDGAVSAPIPIDVAVDMGATHVVALTTRPFGGRAASRTDHLVHVTMDVMLRRYGSALTTAFRRAETSYPTVRAVLHRGFLKHSGGSTCAILAIAPAGSTHVSRMCQNPLVLKQGGQSGFTAVMDTFE